MENSKKGSLISHLQMAEIQLMKDCLINGHDGTAGQVVKTISSLFNDNSEGTLLNIKLESLLANAFSLQIRSFVKVNKNLLFNLCVSLADCIGKNMTLNECLLNLLKVAFVELNKQDVIHSDIFIKYLLFQVEHKPEFSSKFLNTVLIQSHNVLERLILDCFFTDNRNMDSLVKMCTESPELFQSITGILHGILIKSKGHVKVLQIISHFVSSVISECEKTFKNFFKLYPSDTHQLVCLLIIPPQVYSICSSEKSFHQNTVLKVLVDTFMQNRSKALLLLSHYPLWLTAFKNYLRNIV